MNKAVFIDKDGTLIKDVPYNVDLRLIEFEDYVFESLRRIQKQGYYLIIISNQPGIALGYFNETELEKVAKKIEKGLLEQSVALNGFYYCPHSAESQCMCRKPRPGLLFKAAKDMQIDLSASWMIGDILHDVEAGKRSGAKTILLDRGNETEWLYNECRKPDFLVKNFKEATDVILTNC